MAGPRPDEPLPPQAAAEGDEGDLAASPAAPLLQRVSLLGLWLLLGALALVLLAAGSVVVAKAVRRGRRRGTGAAATRIAAAWAEVVDRLREAGVPVAVHQTPVEVAAGVSSAPAGSPVAATATRMAGRARSGRGT